MAKNKQVNTELKPLPKPVTLRLPSVGETEPRPSKGKRKNTARTPVPDTEGPNKHDKTPVAVRGQSPKRQTQTQKRQDPQSRPKPSRKKFNMNPRIIQGLSIGVIVIALLFAVTVFANNLIAYNALEVFVGGKSVGYIQMNPDLEASQLQNQAVLQLQSGLGTSVEVIEQVTIQPVRRVARRDMSSQSEMIRLITQNFTYKSWALAIYVDGNRELLLRSQECADTLLEMLAQPWVNEHTVNAGYVTNWELVPELADVQDESVVFLSPLDALARLDRPVTAPVEHTIAQGEFLGTLAIRYGTTAERIAQENGITTETILQPGRVLTIYTRRPLLLVRTIDEITITEDIEMDVETRENPDLAQSVSNVLAEGRNGQVRSTTRIIRENGRIISEETLEEQVLIEPLTHVVEIGTGPAAIERR